MLKLYNTLTHKIEDFKPIKPPEVGYYSCGPTVYDFAHIGHARTYIFADVLQRALVFNDYQVKRVMNITDVGHLTSDSDTGEDKMELASRRSGRGAAREKKSVWDIAEFYTKDFMEMINKLNIIKPEIICKATDHITSMIRIIELLHKKGYTYQIGDGVYFDTSKLSDYGKLTGQSFAQLQKTLKAGARIEMVEGKKHPTDFALWKLTPAGVKRQMEWDSPFAPSQTRGEGKGFPGWHIECSAMSMKFLGETFDIHTGGVDHIPIHHTNEIAQSEAATGKKFVKYWLHASHLLVDGEKMSKSLGNFYRLKDIVEKKYHPLSLRYLFLTAHYRTQMNFTWKALEAADNAYTSLISSVVQLRQEGYDTSPTQLSQEKLTKIDDLRLRFTESVNDNLGTPLALAVVWETIKSNIPPGDKYELLLLFDEVLGLNLKKTIRQLADHKEKTDLEIPLEIKELVNDRETLRKEKKFAEADKLRKDIENKGYSVEDSPQGPQIASRGAKDIPH